VANPRYATQAAGHSIITIGCINALNTADEIVVYCQMGSRSAMALQCLRQVGFRKVKNLVGGFDAWAREIDPTMPRY
jgi:sulfur-carrier protein adenylyltransferase/sulfurtransferase